MKARISEFDSTYYRCLLNYFGIDAEGMEAIKQLREAIQSRKLEGHDLCPPYMRLCDYINSGDFCRLCNACLLMQLDRMYWQAFETSLAPREAAKTGLCAALCALREQKQDSRKRGYLAGYMSGKRGCNKGKYHDDDYEVGYQEGYTKAQEFLERVYGTRDSKAVCEIEARDKAKRAGKAGRSVDL